MWNGQGKSQSKSQFMTPPYPRTTGQSIFLIGKVPIEFLPGKRHITWVLAALLFSAEFQMEPLALNVIYYYTT